MVNFRYLFFLLLIAALSPAFADDGHEAPAALARCLDDPAHFLPTGQSSAPPPGLSRQDQVEVAHGPRGRLFEFRGTAQQEIACGIALYGPVAPRMRAQLLKTITSRRNEPTGSDPVSDAGTGTVTYWGDAKGHGLSGIVMIERPPSPTAPTLQIDFHNILIH